jgi:hypothetical protein
VVHQDRLYHCRQVPAVVDQVSFLSLGQNGRVEGWIPFMFLLLSFPAMTCHTLGIFLHRPL